MERPTLLRQGHNHLFLGPSWGLVLHVLDGTVVHAMPLIRTGTIIRSEYVAEVAAALCAGDINAAVLLPIHHHATLDTSVKGAPCASVHELRDTQVCDSATTLACKVALCGFELVS